MLIIFTFILFLFILNFFSNQRKQHGMTDKIVFPVDRTQIWCLGYLTSREPPIDYTALEYNLDLPWVMSFLLVLHLPRLLVWQRGMAVAN